MMKTQIAPLLDFFFNDAPPTEIYTLPLPDALPISSAVVASRHGTSGRPYRSSSAACERYPSGTVVPTRPDGVASGSTSLSDRRIFVHQAAWATASTQRTGSGNAGTPPAWSLSVTRSGMPIHATANGFG